MSKFVLHKVVYVFIVELLVEDLLTENNIGENYNYIIKIKGLVELTCSPLTFNYLNCLFIDVYQSGFTSFFYVFFEF